MADLFPVAGARIFIGGQLDSKATDFVAADFAGETWVEIDGWETAGGYGDAAEEITTQLINRGRDLRQKGTRNAGNMTNQFAELNGDVGQAAMIAAEQTRQNYAFRIEYDDKEVGDTTGSTDYFVGLVMSWNRTGGQANTILMREANIGINSNIVYVAAA